MNKAVCPTITAYSVDEYKQQLNRVAPFAERIHIDLMDGQFAPTRSPELSSIWLPKSTVCDVHLMYKDPMSVAETIEELHPSLIIVHAEAEHVSSFVHTMHEARMKVGIALLPNTPTSVLSHFINVIDHVLIFSGNLGYHGGQADLTLVHKITEVRQLSSTVEISWDGGINDVNIGMLAEAGVNVFNVGGFIQNDPDPSSKYNLLTSLI